MKRLLTVLLIAAASISYAQTRVHVSQIKTVETMAQLMSSNPTSASHGTWVKLRGHTLAGIGGGDFYYDKDCLEPHDGGVYVKPTSIVGAGRWIREGRGQDGVKPEWWGAVGDAKIDFLDFDLASSTDDSSAFQAALDFLANQPGAVAGASGTYPSFLEIGDRGYYLGSTVEAPAIVTIRGKSAAKSFTRGLGSFLTGAPSQEIIKVVPASGTIGGAITIDGVGFRGYAYQNGALCSRVLCALLFDGFSAPARPINITNCTFDYFDEAAIRVVGSGTTLYTMNVTNNHFTYTPKTLDASGVGGLRYIGNVSDEGKVYVNRLYGTYDISDNLMQGTHDLVGITLKTWLATGRIGPNYWEYSGGTDPNRPYGIQVVKATDIATAPWTGWSLGNSHVEISRQYTSGMGPVRVLVEDNSVVLSDGAKESIALTARRASSGSRLNGSHLWPRSPYFDTGGAITTYESIIRTPSDVYGDIFTENIGSPTESIASAQYIITSAGNLLATNTEIVYPAGIGTGSVAAANPTETVAIAWYPATFTTNVNYQSALIANFFIETMEQNMTLSFQWRTEDATPTVLINGADALFFGNTGWHAVTIALPMGLNYEAVASGTRLSLFHAPTSQSTAGVRVSPLWLYPRTRYWPAPFVHRWNFDKRYY